MISTDHTIAKTKFQFAVLTDNYLQELLACFNNCFKAYFVPLQFSMDQFKKKIVAEAIDLRLSIGMFHEGSLIGFVLQAVEEHEGKRVVYNAGTGILPQYRGRGLAMPMYEFALTLVRENGPGNSVLEVIDQNKAAIRLYKRCGFTICRQMDSFTCASFPPDDNKHQIEVVSVADDCLLQSMCEWQPAWQYSWNTLARCDDDYQFFAATDGIAHLAYCAANFQTGRVAHFGCNDWGKDKFALHSLFSLVTKNASKPLSVIHVDHHAENSKNFLVSIGFMQFLKCFEMKRDL